ncbi:hypothetical protein MKEN_00562500 [Mycena kentingensis (nom. inval.)]|nr:hypothetical protein MKEN_00562500 [Mycena kentingensis (nom. inval.)]
MTVPQIDWSVYKTDQFWSTRCITDPVGRILAVLAGQPNTRRYSGIVRRTYDAFKKAGAGLTSPKHRRGLYTAVTVGLSYGQGQEEPGYLSTNYPDSADELLLNPDVQEMADFANTMFQRWAPRLYNHYDDYNRKIDDWDAKKDDSEPKLRRPFPKGVFAAAAFNCGPKVWTFKHRDMLNLPYGWCAVQALGRFNPKRGGHLVFWDLKLVVEFPPGALILFPSATLLHSNIPVAEGEECASFTQWSAGGLFRFVDNGFRTEAQFAAAEPKKFEAAMARKPKRWAQGVKLWSTINEIASIL